MDYSYLASHDRKDGRPAPENGRGHPQNQYPVHCEHQQYPTRHQVMSTGYPSHGFGPYVQPIHGLVHHTGPGLGSVLTSRILVQDSGSAMTSASSGSSSRIPSHGRQDFASPMQVQSTPTSNVSDPLGKSSRGQDVEPQLHVLEPVVHASEHSGHKSGPCDPTPHPSEPVPMAQSPGHLAIVHMGEPADEARISETSGKGTRSEDSTPRLHVLQPVTQSPDPALPAKRSGPLETSLQLHTQSPVSTQLAKRSRPLDTSHQIHALEPVWQNPQPPVKSQRPPRLSTKGCQTDPLFEEVEDVDDLRNTVLSLDLPEGLGYVEMRDQMNKRLGVMATEVLKEGKEFGPFTGDFVKEGLGSVNPATWEICVKGKTRFYISGTKDNWMTRVQVARSKQEQNLEAFQFYGDIFFRTTKAIEAGTELRVFYSKDYSRKVGFRADLEDLTLDQGSKRFECKDCRCHYTNAKSLLRHVKFEHDKENVPEPSKESPGKQAQDEVTMSKTPARGKRWIIKSTRTVKKAKEQVSNLNERSSKKETASKNKTTHKRKASVTKGTTPNKVLKQLHVKIVPKETKKAASRIKTEVVQRFACDICQKSFPSIGHLDAHMAFHVDTVSPKNVCSTCGLECKNTRVFKQHVISHDPDAYRCHVCSKYFRRKSRMVGHLRYDHNIFVGKKWARADLDDLLIKQQDSAHKQGENTGDEKEIRGVKVKPTCEKCSEEFNDMESLEKHSESHTKGNFNCRYCSEKFVLNSQLIAHFRKDHKIFLWKKHGLKKSMNERLARLIIPDNQPEDTEGTPAPFHPELPKDMYGKRIVQRIKLPKTFKCTYCPKTYTNFGRCVRHEKEVHTNSGEYMCEFCSAMFVRETQYILHKRKHTKDRPFKCKECPQSFGSESALEKHMPQHRGECPFKCDICGNGYKTRKNMMTHRRRTHTLPKQMFPCRYCGREFKENGPRNRHESCHKGIRSHVCFTCGKAFRSAHSLKCHTMIHTGEKPYECRYCQRKFRLQHQLTVHMVIHERDKKPDQTSEENQHKY